MRTGWLQYDFSRPQTVQAYKIERRDGAASVNAFSPTAWTLYGRNGNSSAWRILDTQSGHGTWGNGEIKAFGVQPSYAGSCGNGTLVAAESRTQHDHCGNCSSGYILANKTCIPGAPGSCLLLWSPLDWHSRFAIFESTDDDWRK